MKSSPGYCTKKQNIQVGLLIKQCPGCTLELQIVITYQTINAYTPKSTQLTNFNLLHWHNLNWFMHWPSSVNIGQKLKGLMYHGW